MKLWVWVGDVFTCDWCNDSNDDKIKYYSVRQKKKVKYTVPMSIQTPLKYI